MSVSCPRVFSGVADGVVGLRRLLVWVTSCPVQDARVRLAVDSVPVSLAVQAGWTNRAKVLWRVS